MIKKFAEGYWCASPYWKTCQLDCGDCNMLHHLDDIERKIGIEWFGEHGKKKDI